MERCNVDKRRGRFSERKMDRLINEKPPNPMGNEEENRCRKLLVVDHSSSRPVVRKVIPLICNSQSRLVVRRVTPLIRNPPSRPVVLGVKTTRRNPPTRPVILQS